MIIRPEKPQDYASIARVNQRAFKGRLSEGLIVALHRQRLSFDPELSLIAEENGAVIGHVLFTPHTLRLHGLDVRAVNLAPIAIDPEYQKRGIGGKLINEGHRIAREKGYQLSFLLGHPEYYVKFGYKTHAYGSASLNIHVDEDAAPQALTIRDVVEADIPYLVTLWINQMHAVDFSTLPEPTLSDWVSANPKIRTQVYLRGNEIIGYTRGDESAENWSVFLAQDAASAKAMLISLNGQSRMHKLPIHPHASWVQATDDVTSQAWGAGMAYPLISDTPFEEYYTRVKAGDYPAGQAVWGTAFDL